MTVCAKCKEKNTEESLSVEYENVQIARLAAKKIDDILAEMGVTIEVGIGTDFMVARSFKDKDGKAQEAKVVLANVPF